jgi:hypothetical protein
MTRIREVLYVVPGIAPRAYKRNVLVVLLYLLLIGIGLAVADFWSTQAP